MSSRHPANCSSARRCSGGISDDEWLRDRSASVRTATASWARAVTTPWCAAVNWSRTSVVAALIASMDMSSVYCNYNRLNYSRAA